MQEITITDVCTYRELYYEHVKPLLNAGKRPEVISELMAPIYKEYGWTEEKFQLFSMIDFMQRLAKTNDTRLKLRVGGQDVNYANANNLPELKCPRRTEQKD